jgi:N6-L-threonylcarbamoyladenine synthase
MIALAAALRVAAGRESPRHDLAFDVRPRWALDAIESPAAAV